MFKTPLLTGICTASLCLAFALAPARAQEAGDAEAGLGLARSVCAGCHVVERGQPPQPESPAPSFESLARTPGMTALAINVLLRTPHRTMPNLVLNEREVDDLAAYILSLK